jgi:hypothetical protein
MVYFNCKGFFKLEKIKKETMNSLKECQMRQFQLLFFLTLLCWFLSCRDGEAGGFAQFDSETKGLDSLSNLNNLSQVMQNASSGDTIHLPQKMPDHVVYGTVLSAFFSSEKCFPNQVEANSAICKERLDLIIKQFQTLAKGYQKGMSDWKLRRGRRLTCEKLKRALRVEEFFQSLKDCGEFVLEEYRNATPIDSTRASNYIKNYPSDSFSSAYVNEPTRGLFNRLPDRFRFKEPIGAPFGFDASAKSENDDLKPIIGDPSPSSLNDNQMLHYLKQSNQYQEILNAYKNLRQEGFNTIVFIREPSRHELIMAKEVGIKVIMWYQNVFKHDPSTDFLATGKFSVFQESDFIRCRVDGKKHLDISREDVRQKIYQFYAERLKKLDGLFSGYMFDDHISYNYYQSNAQQMEPCLTYQTAQNQINQFVRELMAHLKNAVPNMKAIMAHHPLHHAQQHFSADWSQWRSYFDEFYIQGYVESSWNTYLGDLQRGQFNGILIPLGQHFQQFSTCGAIQKALEMKHAGRSFFLYRDFAQREENFLDLYLKGQTCQ